MVPALTHLRSLTVAGNRLRGVHGLPDLPALDALDVGGNWLEDVGDLEGLHLCSRLGRFAAAGNAFARCQRYPFLMYVSMAPLASSPDCHRPCCWACALRRRGGSLRIVMFLMRGWS